jgi:hypothetical protein
VNILPSGWMNRSYCVSSVRVTVPVQSALTVYVPEYLALFVMLRLKLAEKTPSVLPLPSNH